MCTLTMTFMTVLAHELGVGHSGMSKIAKVLDIPNMHLRTYQRNDKRVSAAGEDCLEIAARKIQEAYLETQRDSPELLRHIGHTSNVAVFGRSEVEHDANVHNLMRVSREHGLVYNSKKCAIKTP